MLTLPGIQQSRYATCRGRHLRVHRAAERRRQLARGGPPPRYPAARRPPSTGVEGTVAQAAATEGASAEATAGQCQADQAARG
jgi:hypothetical protein